MDERKLATGRTATLQSAAMTTTPHYPRFIEAKLGATLADTPIALIHGPRQCGKTTLTQTYGEAHGYGYFSFDDPVVAAAAEADPVGFVGDLPSRVTLDEVQRVPSVFTALKAVVDRDRQPGRFILTGSANVLFVPKLADSLAGRMTLLRLHPLTQCEIAGEDHEFIDRLFRRGFRARNHKRLGRLLLARIASGGYPAALARSSHSRRATWYRDYVEALIQRDVRDLARIRSLDVLPRLLALVAAQTAQLLNVSDLAGPFRISRPTVGDYVTLLERIFVLDVLPPWHSNRLSRLVKTPKIHAGDSGVACSLLGLGPDDLSKDRGMLGHLLETFVFQELRRQASWQEGNLQFFHFRDKDKDEVDVVIERGVREVAGVEVKAGATVRDKDFRGLRKLQRAAGDGFASGAVLYDGETTSPFGERLFAVPIRTLWER